jgi:hypothetical protein
MATPFFHREETGQLIAVIRHNSANGITVFCGELTA